MTTRDIVDAVATPSVVDLEERRRKGGGGDTGILPNDCPVTPLGRDQDGKGFHYLNADRMLVELKDKEHTRQGLVALFGNHQDWIDEHFTRKTRSGTNVDFSELGRKLVQACSARGVFDLTSSIRGRGAWKGAGGELIYHSGDRVFVNGRPFEPGRHGEHVYPIRSRLPLPAPAADPSGAQDLFHVLQSWNWRRGKAQGYIDARLLLAFIALAPFGGVLHWRPHFWVTGDASTGKTTLQDLISLVFKGGLVKSTNPSAAGLYTVLNSDTVPVMLDEIEAKPNSSKTAAVIELMRQASSGGLILRSSAGHKTFEFMARSMFLASSILIPPLENQDLQRITILELKTLADGAAEPNLDPEYWGGVGRELLYRFIAGWRRWPETVAAYREALVGVGHGSRSSFHYAALLAAADLVLGDEIADPDAIALQAESLDPAGLLERQVSAPDWQQCLDYLLEAVIDPYKGGEKTSLLEMIRNEALAFAGDGVMQKALERFGLKVLEQDGEMFLAVALAHNRLADVFQGSNWRKEPSSRLSGWGQSLRRCPGAIDAKTVRMHARPAKAVLIPMRLVYDDSPRTPADAD